MTMDYYLRRALRWHEDRVGVIARDGEFTFGE